MVNFFKNSFRHSLLIIRPLSYLLERSTHWLLLQWKDSTISIGWKPRHWMDKISHLMWPCCRQKTPVSNTALSSNIPSVTSTRSYTTLLMCLGHACSTLISHNAALLVEEYMALSFFTLRTVPRMPLICVDIGSARLLLIPVFISTAILLSAPVLLTAFFGYLFLESAMLLHLLFNSCNSLSRLNVGSESATECKLYCH